MNGWTPTTKQVKTQLTREEPPWIGTVTEKGRAFGRWLEQVRAEAWEKGHEAAAMRVPEDVWHDTANPRTPNPYRQEADA